MNEKWGRAERPSWRCPGETAIAAYVQARLARREKDRLEAHLADCGSCLSHVAALVRAENVRALDPVPDWLLRKAYAMGEESAPRDFAPSLRWAVVGSIALGLTGAFWFYRPDHTSPPAETLRTVRGESAAELEILFPPDGEVIPAREIELRWATAEGALFYEVTLVTADGDLVWQTRIEETHARLPAGVRLIPKERYYVWIRAQFSDSGAIKSKTIAFEVSERP